MLLGDKMALIGFHYTKILVERKNVGVEKMNISNNIVITGVKEANVAIGEQKEAGVEFSFQFKTAYEPKVASIELTGAVVYLTAAAKAKEILTKWGKEKKLAPDILERVYNHLLEKCNIEALMLSRDMQLPPHIPLMKVSAK